MSSGMGYQPGEGRQAAFAASDRILATSENLGMTERQRRLDWLFRWYSGVQYDTRKVDFDGGEYHDPLEREAIITASFIPPGFYDAGQTTPMKLRRPSSSYNLARVIISRFTELLFSSRRHPRIRVEGDPLTEDFIAALVEEAQLWPMMATARAMGGAMGTVALGFQFYDGKPVIEVHDPRWLYPDFVDRASLTLRGVEKRWMYPVEERVVGKRGLEWVTTWYWYRRIIDVEKDLVFKPALVGNGLEPEWEIDEEKSVLHELGFCPVVWVQNLPVIDDLDGEPDCQGCYDQLEEIDQLLSMACRGVRLNCDPTVLVKEDQKMAEIRKGSDNTVKVTKGGDFSYVEISGTGPKAARELAKELREYVLEVAQVVLPPTDGGNVPQTLGQVERAFSSMFAKTDLLQVQYGERGVKPLISLIVKAVRKLQQGKQGEDGRVVKQIVKLPPRVVEHEGGKIEVTPRRLGGGGHLRLIWPPHADPSLDDVQKATTATAEAKEKGLLDQRHASDFVAPFYHVHNVAAMVAKIEEEQKKAAEQAAAMPQGPMPGEV